MNPLQKNNYKGVEVITSDLVAKEHSIKKFKVNELFKNNADRFIENKDVFIIERESLYTSEVYRDLFTNNKQRAAYLFTERGYFKLIKIMNNDRAWDVYEHMVDVYFKAKEVKDMTSRDLLDAWRNAITKEVEKISDKVNELSAHMDYDENYYTITVWFNKNKIKLLEGQSYKSLDKKAKRLSESQGYDIKEVPHPQYNKVNSYHIDILKQL